MTCMHCGAPLNQGQAFCSRCGQAVSETAKQTNDTSVIPEQSAQSPSPATVKQPISKKKKVILIASAMAALVAVVLGIILFATADSREMKRALKTQNVDTVMRVYSRLLRQGKSDVADKVLVHYIEDATDTINEKFTYTIDSQNGASEIPNYMHNTFMRSNWGNVFWDDGRSELYDIESPEVENALDDFDAMADSKIAYYTGEYNMQGAEDYSDYSVAMHNYAKVLESDTLYSDSVEKYEQASNAYFDAVVALADSYISQNDYSAALSLLDDELETDDAAASAELQAKLNEIKKNYAAQYAEKAKNCFTSGDVQTAVGNIQAAIAIYPDGGYEAKLTEYQQYLPFELYLEENVLNEEIDDRFWGTIGYDYNMVSNDNREMNHAIKWYTNNNDASASAKVYYNLEGKYDTVMGTIFLSQDSRDSNLAGYFEVYGDGKLLYTSPKVAAGVLPQDISVSVTGVQKLQIAFHGNGTGGFLGTGADYGVNNLIAKKNIPKS